jgi:polyisoprenyl-teichoic acid--peptidoglycan teichoic acid transferase
LPFSSPHQQVSPARPAPDGNPATKSPYQQPGGTSGAAPFPQPKKRLRRGCLLSSLIVLVLACLLGGFAITTTQRVLAFGSAISPQAPLTTQTSYMNTNNRVNLLVMGYGGGSHDGSYLTDSILIVSVLPQSHHTSLVSVPRDLWVQYPPNSGNYTKINSIYELASNNNRNPQAGGEAAYQKVSLVTGLQVPYWLTIDFTGFKQVIDAIGGIDVYVPDSFNACYPKNDDATIDPSWIKVQFNKGMQHMNGNTAITYARAREPLEVCGKGTSQNLAELTDFGRSARQQIIIKSVLAKVKQFSTWPHLYAAMDALQHAIHTNMSLADLSAFALKMDLADPKAAHIGLSNQNVLMDDTAAGQYVLLPQNGNWGAIKDYVKKNLYN